MRDLNLLNQAWPNAVFGLRPRLFFLLIPYICIFVLHAETEKTAELMDNVSKLYEELISFSDLYDSASFEAKKMIVNQLIRRVDVYRGYQLNITFNFDLTPYIEGDDTAAC